MTRYLVEHQERCPIGRFGAPCDCGAKQVENVLDVHERRLDRIKDALSSWGENITTVRDGQAFAAAVFEAVYGQDA